MFHPVPDSATVLEKLDIYNWVPRDVTRVSRRGENFSWK